MLIKQTKRILFWPAVLVIGLVFGSALQIALAWTVPSATPPGNNVAPPLNTSAIDQAKTGSLTVSGAGERMQASKFIDNDNTNFFLDPNSSSKLSFATFDNLESLGFVSANRMVTSAYMQAPVFYDNNNINFKVDPNNTSTINNFIAKNETRLCDGNATSCKTWLSDDGYIEDSNDGFLRLRMIYGMNFDVTGGDICTDKGGSWHCLSTAGAGGAISLGNTDCAMYSTGWNAANGTQISQSCPADRPYGLSGGCDSVCPWIYVNYMQDSTQYCNVLTAGMGGTCVYPGQDTFRALIKCCK